MAKKNGGARRGGGGGAAAEGTGASALGELRAELTRALASSVEETVDAVCARFDESAGSSSLLAGRALDPLADYDMYHGCCARLVRYIEANMETSPEFAQQMERIILACHSNAAEHVLRSVATKDVWFHRRRGPGEPVGPSKHEETARAAKTRQQPPPPPDSPPPSPRMTRSAEKRGVATRSAEKPGVATRSAEKPAAVASQASGRTSRVSTRSAEKRSAGTRTRSGSREPSPAPKRPRRAAARVVLDTESSEEEQEEQEEEEEDEEKEEEQEEVKESAKPPRKGRRGRPSQPHYEQGDELLLNFEDPIGELCYPDRRTPEQTKFFKERLRRSIEFVDAQLCQAPPGQFCSRNCKKLRAVMCNGDKPCKNKTCRIWHDVEVHADCCENAQCEFKNRIMLRETMHKIEHSKQDLQRNRAQLQAKRKHVVAAKRGDQHDREKLVETTLLENEISQLEHDIEVSEEELSRFTATRKAFWGILHEIGIQPSDDIADQFPDFDTHYTSRRPPHKPKTPLKSKRSVSPTRTPPARQSERSLRRRGTNPHEEATATVSTRATRRSSRASQDSDAQVIDVEEEESKEGSSQVASNNPETETNEEAGKRLTEATPAAGFTLRTNPPSSGAPVETRTAEQGVENAQEAATADQQVPVQNGGPESAQNGVAADEEREIHEEAEAEHQEEVEVVHRQEVAIDERRVQVVVEQHEEVVVEQQAEVVVEHREEAAAEHHEGEENHEEPVPDEEGSLDHHDDQMDDEDENAFSAMNARWPGGL